MVLIQVANLRVEECKMREFGALLDGEQIMSKGKIVEPNLVQRTKKLGKD